MKIATSGVAAIVMCNINFNGKHLELIIQLLIACITGYFQYKQLKKNDKKL